MAVGTPVAEPSLPAARVLFHACIQFRVSTRGWIGKATKKKGVESFGASSRSLASPSNDVAFDSRVSAQFRHGGGCPF